VVAADISGNEKVTAEEMGDAVLPVHCDVTIESDVAALFAAAVEAFGHVDCIVNVAGVDDAVPLVDVTMEAYDRLMDINVRGVFLGMKHGIPKLLEAGGGSIVNYSSVGGLNASFTTNVYSATKAAVISLTKSAAGEYGGAGIRANAICPGFIRTEGMGANTLDYPEVYEKAPLHRIGEADEVSEVAAFLSSDKASFLTGAIIPVDGGVSAMLAV
jgi:NAD(P)-dependent dehydrogenase (short-subunit alcohol dehydrogenase family)